MSVNPRVNARRRGQGPVISRTWPGRGPRGTPRGERGGRRDAATSGDLGEVVSDGLKACVVAEGQTSRKIYLIKTLAVRQSSKQSA